MLMNIVVALKAVSKALAPIIPIPNNPGEKSMVSTAAIPIFKHNNFIIFLAPLFNDITPILIHKDNKNSHIF